jgi:hypothetical protein
VAVFLGWLILSEKISGAVVIGGGVVVLAVAIVITAERPTRKRPRTARAPETATETRPDRPAVDA